MQKQRTGWNYNGNISETFIKSIANEGEKHFRNMIEQKKISINQETSERRESQ